MAEKMMHPAASRMYLDSCLHLFLKYKYPSEICLCTYAYAPAFSSRYYIAGSWSSSLDPYLAKQLLRSAFLLLLSNVSLQSQSQLQSQLKEDTSDYRNTSDSAMLPTCQSVLAGGGSARAVARRWPMTMAVVFKAWPADSNSDEMEEMHQNNNYSSKLN